MPIYALVSAKRKWGRVKAASSVDAGKESLSRGFFVARRPIDLPREEESSQPLGFERSIELGGLDEVGTQRHILA